MSGLLYVVNLTHGNGILCTIKQLFLLALIVPIFLKLNPLLSIVTMHSTVTKLSRILFIYSF